MDIPLLKGPDGQPADPAKTFILDGNGRPISSSEMQKKDFALPSVLTMTAVISGSEKTYLANSFDNALRHNYRNAMSMYRDCRIHSWLEERVESVVNLKWRLEIDDEKDENQKCVRDGLTKAMRRIPHFKRILRNILKWALWGGRGCSHLCWDFVDMDLPIVEQPNLFDSLKNGSMNGKANHYADMMSMSPWGMNGHYEEFPGAVDSAMKNAIGDNGDGPEGQGGPPKPKEPAFKLQTRPVLMPIKNRMVNGDKINYVWGYTPRGAPPGTPLVRVHYGIGYDIEDAEIVYDNIGPNIVLANEWRDRFCIMTYDPDDADYFSPEMAGGIHGNGIRSRIYWANWTRMDYASWITDLYDRLGLGFIQIKYDMASNQAKKNAEEMAKKWARKSVVIVPVTADQLQRAGGVEVVEVPTMGAALVQEIVKYMDKHIERYILRQTIGGGGGSQGDGMRGTVGPAEMAAKTEVQRIKADAEDLAEAITGSLDEPGIVSVMQKHTYPGTFDEARNQLKFAVRFKFIVSEESSKERLQVITMGAGIGVDFVKDEVRDITEMRKPDAGEETVGGDKGNKQQFGEEGGDDNSASKKAAQQWLAEGRSRGRLNELAEQFGISKQAVSREAKRLEGGRENVEKVLPT